MATRVALLNAAYADYYIPVHVTTDQLGLMDRAYDVDLVRSLVAVAGAAPVGVASVGVRGQRAWVGGVGILPAWRRQGIGRALMTWIIAGVNELDIGRIFLEVISENEPALRLYESMGFHVARELLTWRRGVDADPLPIPDVRLDAASPGVLLRNFDAWHDQPACWQAERSTLAGMAGRMKGYLLQRPEGPAGYCLVNDVAESAWLLDVGVRPGRDETISGRVLLQAIAAQYLGRPLEIVNVPADSSLNRVLAALRFRVITRQLEMQLALGVT